MTDLIIRLSNIGNIDQADARIILAFSQEWEIAEAIVNASVWELRDKCRERAWKQLQ